MKTGLVVRAKGAGTIINRADPDNLTIILVRRVESDSYKMFEGTVDELAELVELGYEKKAEQS